MTINMVVFNHFKIRDKSLSAFPAVIWLNYAMLECSVNGDWIASSSETSYQSIFGFFVACFSGYGSPSRPRFDTSEEHDRRRMCLSKYSLSFPDQLHPGFGHTTRMASMRSSVTVSMWKASWRPHVGRGSVIGPLVSFIALQTKRMPFIETVYPESMG